MGQNRNHGWGVDLARRLGTHGTIERMNTREGATIHVRCAGKNGNDHIVDVKIRPNDDPNGVAKQMLNAGWTLGRRKIACPDCGKRKKTPREKVEQSAMPLPVISPEVTPTPPEKPVATDRFAKARARITPEQRREFGRKGGLTREANRLKREEERLRQQGRIPAAPCPTLKETKTMATQEQGATPTASDRARIAKREALDTLALAFKMAPDGKSGVYESGYSDARIAKETGLAESKIKEMREEFYGPLGEPDELREIREMFKTAETAYLAAARMFDQESARVTRRFEALCSKMGWPFP